MTNQQLYKGFTPLRALALASMLAGIAPVCLADSNSSSDWEYVAYLYFWGADIEVKTTGGQEVDLPFYQIWDDLDFAFMTEVGARNDEWSIMTDVIYLNLTQKNNLRDDFLPGDIPVTVNDKLDMTSWIITPTVGYALHNADNARVEVVGGLRYLSIDLGIEIDVNDDVVFNRSASEGFWDGIVGLRSNINLGQGWYLPAYADVGFGSSDSTWQALAGVGYHFSSWDAVLTYRYLNYNFDHDVASDMVIRGPLLGAVFTF